MLLSNHDIFEMNCDKMKGETINVLIPDANSGHSLIVARCLSKVPKLRLHVMSEKPWTALRFSRKRKYYLFGSLGKGKVIILDPLKKIVEKTRSDVLLPVDEPSVRIVSKNLQTLKEIISIVPVPNVRAFDIAVDKWQLAKFLIEQHIPCPHTILLNRRSLTQNLDSLKFPAIIKPIRGQGGHGIKLFDTKDQFTNFLKNNKVDPNSKFIVQQYIAGYDIDCSVLAKDGKILAFTIQRGFIPRSKKYAAPAGVSFLYEDRVIDVTRQVISALSFSGVAHVDLRYDQREDNFKIIEINARYWGSLTASFLAGVNFPYLACLAGLGIPFETPQYRMNQFIDHTAAIKQIFNKFFHKKSYKIRFAETDLSFFLSDPLAEIVNKFIRWFNH